MALTSGAAQGSLVYDPLQSVASEDIVLNRLFACGSIHRNEHDRPGAVQAQPNHEKRQCQDRCAWSVASDKQE